MYDSRIKTTVEVRPLGLNMQRGLTSTPYPIKAPAEMTTKKGDIKHVISTSKHVISTEVLRMQDAMETCLPAGRNPSKLREVY